MLSYNLNRLHACELSIITVFGLGCCGVLFMSHNVNTQIIVICVATTSNK